MRFVQWNSEETVRRIAEAIVTALSSGSHVVWLVSGGNNVALQVAIMQAIRQQASSELPRLTILPIDERYGLSGHTDSNYAAMQRVGFDPGVADWPDVLAEDLDFAATTTTYKQRVTALFDEADTIVATLGIGTDGHIAGVLPQSPAAASSELVVGYPANFQRMTVTLAGIKSIDQAFVIARGQDKAPIIERLQEQPNISPVDFPALALYELSDCTVIGRESEIT